MSFIKIRCLFIRVCVHSQAVRLCVIKLLGVLICFTGVELVIDLNLFFDKL